MSWYYVTHPNIDLSAVVDAPSTEKARTTFLDYLERRGAVGRAYRGSLRENMVAERISDPYGVQADVELHYGGGYPEEFVSRGEYLERIPRETEIPEEIELGEEMVEIPLEEPQQPTRPDIEEVAGETPERMSPIQKMALRGYVG